MAPDFCRSAPCLDPQPWTMIVLRGGSDRPGSGVDRMPRARWLVIGALLAVGIVGGAINARGPFEAHPSLSYAQFLADFEAGRVGQIAQWRNQLEVTEGSALLGVVVPVTADFPLDLAPARRAGARSSGKSAVTGTTTPSSADPSVTSSWFRHWAICPTRPASKSARNCA